MKKTICFSSARKDKHDRMFEFSQKRMEKKLHKLQIAVENSPKKAEQLEKLLREYEAEIKQNLQDIDDIDKINAQLQAVRQEIKHAKQENLEPAQ